MVKKFLFLDNQYVDETYNLFRKFHPAIPHPFGPVLRAGDSDGERFPFVYGTVLRDEESRHFRMWYHERVARGKFPEHEIRYATSEDGLHWEKPKLGIISDAEGRKDTNIVHTHHNPNIIYDPFDGDEKRRYKMFAYEFARHAPYGKNGYVVSFSPDGLHWTDSGKNPVIPGGDVCSACYDPDTHRFVSFPKVFCESNGLLRRSVSVSFSDDFEDWTNPQPILLADSVDDKSAIEVIRDLGEFVPYRQTERTHAELYGLCGFSYEGMWIGLLWIFYVSGQKADDMDDGVCDIQLTHSYCGLHWHRTMRRQVFIARGQPKSPTGGWINSARAPVEVGDEIWFYYSGRNITHKPLPTQTIHPDSGIYIATLRRDGFVSWEGGWREDAWLLTKRLAPKGDGLYVNCDPKNGYLLVQVEDDIWHRPIPGFERENCIPIKTDSVSCQVKWKNADWRGLRMTNIHLRFFIYRGSLYSFWFA